MSSSEDDEDVSGIERLSDRALVLLLARAMLRRGTCIFIVNSEIAGAAAVQRTLLRQRVFVPH